MALLKKRPHIDWVVQRIEFYTCNITQLEKSSTDRVKGVLISCEIIWSAEHDIFHFDQICISGLHHNCSPNGHICIPYMVTCNHIW